MRLRFKVDDEVAWMGQDGMKFGTVARITMPENSGQVLWISRDGMEDLPLPADAAGLVLKGHSPEKTIQEQEAE